MGKNIYRPSSVHPTRQDWTWLDIPPAAQQSEFNPVPGRVRSDPVPAEAADGSARGCGPAAQLRRGGPAAAELGAGVRVLLPQDRSVRQRQVNQVLHHCLGVRASLGAVGVWMKRGGSRPPGEAPAPHLASFSGGNQ